MLRYASRLFELLNGGGLSCNFTLLLQYIHTAINHHSFPVQFSGLPSKLFVHTYKTLCPCSSYLCDTHRGCWWSSSHNTRRFPFKPLC